MRMFNGKNQAEFGRRLRTLSNEAHNRSAQGTRIQRPAAKTAQTTAQSAGRPSPQRQQTAPRQNAAAASRTPQQSAAPSHTQRAAQPSHPANAARAPQNGQNRPAQGQNGAAARRPAAAPRRRGASNRLFAIVLLVLCAVGLVLYLTKNAGGGTPAESAGPHGVEISEVMTSNKGTVPDENGDFPDWIELHNTTGSKIDIGGFGLSDSPLGVVKWAIPAGTEIEPNGYLIIYCSGTLDGGPLHAAFKLSASDVLTLSTDGGAVIEQVQLKAVASGMTLAKDAGGAFVEMSPSPGYPNTPEGQAAFVSMLSAGAGEDIGVYLNEFMASNASTIVGPDGSYCDWIELYNTTGSTIDLSGYGISDSSAQPLKYTLPDGTKIEPNGVLLIYCTGRAGTSNTAIEAPFGLRAYQEEVVFSTPAGKILDSYAYTRQETDKSMMRSPDGTGAWQQTSQPTPGYPNTANGLSAFTASLSFGTRELILSEVLAANTTTLRQADLTYPDWIEICNQSGEAVNLAGYALSKNAKNPAKWVFPDITIGPGEYIVVLASGKNVTDTQKKNLETNFSISAEGDAIFLFAPDGTLIDKLLLGRAHADVSYGRSNGQLMYYASPTPGAANSGGMVGYAEKPEFATPAGVYTSAESVSIKVPEGCTVRYTTDCTTPTESSPIYSSPITVSTNTVIRARAFRQGYEPSDTATATFFIRSGSQTLESHDTPFTIISLVTDPDNMFGTTNGIYVAGSKFAEKDPTGDAASFTIPDDTANVNWKYANFNAQHQTNPDPLGLNWERPVHIEVIDTNGSFEYGDDAMVRVFGAFSRYKSQKGLALVTRGGYGASTLNDAFFGNRTYTSYKSLTLRPSAMDCFMSKIRDVLIQGLLEDAGSTLPTQAYRRTIVYINGKYWGIYNLREKVNKYFLAQHYNIGNPDAIDVLVGNGVTEASQISGTNAYLEYKELIDWVGSHDLSNPDNYAYIQTKIDVENFAEYCAMEIFVGNTDTGNIKFWKSAAYDNKWRWIPYDFDWAFNRNDDKSEESTAGYRRDFFKKYFHETGHGVGKGFSTVLSRGLLKNSNFRALFLQKCAFMYNEVFPTEKMLARIEALASEMQSEMNYDTQRWDGFSMKTWERSIENLKDSAKNAPEYFLKYCQSYFSLSDSEMVQLFGKTSDK